MIQRIKNIIKSKKFLYFFIALFAAQALFFAAAINYKIPSDEEYHYTFINYYAQQPITSGPIIADQNELFNLGDIQRTPSYAFHYASSFYLRLVQAFTSNVETQVFMLRLVNIAFGVMALLLLVRLAKRIGIADVTTNLTIAWLSMTGMFIWVFAGISYDNLAIVLFFILLLQLTAMQERIRVKVLVFSILTGIALVLVKETYLPVAIIGFMLLFGYRIAKDGIIKNIKDIKTSFAKVWASKQRVLFIFICLLTILFAGLFTERYAVNYSRYKKFTPTCDQVHSVEECMQQGIYRRNTGTKMEFEQRKKEEVVKLDNLPVFSVKWLNYVYQRTYFYRGMQSSIVNPKASQVALVTSIFASILLLFGLLRIRSLTPAQLGIGIMALLYCLIVLLYNFNTYRFYGYAFAIQGRYLLPVLPFIYMAIIGSARLVYRKLRGGIQLGFIFLILFLVGNNIAVHSPIIIYLNSRSILDTPVVGIIKNLS